MSMKFINILKHTFLLCFLSIPCLCVNSQVIRFTYDDAGNRIRREVVSIQEINVGTEDEILQKYVNSNRLSREVTIRPDQDRDIIHVDFKDKTVPVDYKISLFSISGLLAFESQSDAHVNNINLSDLPNGIYILVLNCNSESSAWKIFYSK